MVHWNEALSKQLWPPRTTTPFIYKKCTMTNKKYGDVVEAAASSPKDAIIKRVPKNVALTIRAMGAQSPEYSQGKVAGRAINWYFQQANGEDPQIFKKAERAFKEYYGEKDKQDEPISVSASELRDKREKLVNLQSSLGINMNYMIDVILFYYLYKTKIDFNNRINLVLNANKLS